MSETLSIARKGIGGHQSAKMRTDEWLTPPEILNALGEFDLDPCAPINRPWNMAKEHFTVMDNGLKKDWSGRVWLNPPYGLQCAKWLNRLALHGNGIALIFARTETDMFFEHVWGKADAILFIKGRLHFHNTEGQRARANAGAPSVLVAFGYENVSVLKHSKIPGKLILLEPAKRSRIKSLFEQPLPDKIMSTLSFLNDEAQKTNDIIKDLIMDMHPECNTYDEVQLKLNPPKEKQLPKEIILSMEAIEVLKRCSVEGMIVKLPPNQLKREDYLAVKSKLELIGGKWKGGKVDGFVFQEDPTELLQQIANGEDRNLKKEFQFFATPRELARKMASLIKPNKEMKILEPSAGDGALIQAFRNFHHASTCPESIDCFEIMDLNVTKLKRVAAANLIGSDFMESDFLASQYDAIIANPPFTKNQDIDHIRKMFECLKPGGRLVTIASPSWTFGSQKKQAAFREWLEELNATIEELPENTFKESGTGIRAMLIVIDKPHVALFDTLKDAV